MPGMILVIRCLNCRYKTRGQMYNALSKADKHAETRGHELSANRVDGSKFCLVHPPDTVEVEFR